MSIFDGTVKTTWPLTPESAAQQALTAIASRKGGQLHVSDGGRVFAFWSGTPPVRMLGHADGEEIAEFLGSLPDVD
ncbi:hypothetical protein ACFROC_19410 [Nocardia tengchongensis]|uniref:hypothetical protein n=1 Tax=Nocardia tengchongensis TaxID=2055889 RepID=UPI00367B7750